MTDTDTTLSATTDQIQKENLPSVWSNRYKIASIESEPWRWNKDWETILRTLSASRDVYPLMGKMYKKGVWDPAKLSEHVEGLKERVSDFQETVVVKSWDLKIGRASCRERV